MRRLLVLVGILSVACADQAPTKPVSSKDANASLSLSRGNSDQDDFNNGKDDHARFNTKMRAEDEIPTSTSLSEGRARIRIPETGPIKSLIEIDNKGNEVIRFCHIHWIDPNSATPGTGPVVWFLTPTGQNMSLVSSFFVIGRDADYVTNPAFGADNAANEATARAALLADPSKFYVNCHSNAFPGGFVRGKLPGNHSDH